MTLSRRDFDQKMAACAGNLVRLLADQAARNPTPSAFNALKGAVRLHEQSVKVLT